MFGLIVLGLLLFLPAGTLNYWQAWVFIATTMAATIVPTLCIARTDPAALQRRMHAGPKVETRAIQKVVIVGAILSILLMLTFSAFDRRVGWSHPSLLGVPARRRAGRARAGHRHAGDYPETVMPQPQ